MMCVCVCEREREREREDLIEEEGANKQTNIPSRIETRSITCAQNKTESPAIRYSHKLG